MVNLLGDLWYETTLPAITTANPTGRSCTLFLPSSCISMASITPGPVARWDTSPFSIVTRNVPGKSRWPRAPRSGSSMRPEKNDIDRAVALLQAGELVAFPTETVYGLGADAANPPPSPGSSPPRAAGRSPADRPSAADGYLDRWARDIPAVAWELAEAFWPGPLTLILKCAPRQCRVVTGGQDSVGLRVPAHPAGTDLLRAYARAGGGLAGMCGIAAPIGQPLRPHQPDRSRTCARGTRDRPPDPRRRPLPGRHRVDDSRPDAR
jgi:hypothetical protein